MKLISWNVNGLRAVHRNGFWEAFLALKPDIFCLQETKADPSQLPAEVREVKGYQSFFNSSRARKGYSGVAIYTKVDLLEVTYGMGIERFDVEGRLITAYFKDFALINCYFPNGGMGPERLAFKMDFYDAFLSYVENIRKKQPNVIFCGDVNTAHEEIDLARPKENQDVTGFLPEERAWIDEVIRNGYLDIFRQLNPEKAGAYTYWDMKTHARDRNVGWRIDYFFITRPLQNKVAKVDIHSKVFGSDHCPISLELKNAA